MTRTDLSESAQALLEVTRDVYEPSASNRAQVRWRVDHALAAGAAVAPSRAARRRALSLGLAAAAVVAVGAAAALTWSGVQSYQPPRTVVDPRGPAGEDPAHIQASALGRSTAARPAEEMKAAGRTPSPASATRGATHAKPISRSARSGRGDLSGEITLIARAQSATNRGDAEKALDALKEYDRKHPDGELAEERSAARILALCAAGRKREARAAAARFLAKWPRSPQAARIHSSCAR